MSPSSANALALRQLQSETDAIREAPVPRAPRIAIKLLAGMLASAAALTCVIPVDRVVTSESGKIVPTEAINVFQALDPSIIKSIDVKEGQSVAKGQVLATLDQTFAAADVDQLKLQLAGLDAEITRAEAELAGKVPVFATGPDALEAHYAAIQQALFLQRSAQYTAQLASFNDKVAQTQATIAKLANDESRYGEREKISQQLEAMRQYLAEREIGSKVNLLAATDARLELLRTLENDHNSLVESRNQLSSLQADADAFKQQWAAQLSQELVTARNTRDQADAAYAKAVKHQDLVVWRAPEDAVVLKLARLSVGSVLKPGDELLTLMPAKAPVEAEIHVASRNIGFIKIGDEATIKVDAFNPVEHGVASGSVIWISEDAFSQDDVTTQAVEPYYKARVSILEKHFIGVPDGFRLIPGMTLATDLKVGRRSLARYFLGGALRGVGESMREP